MITLTAQSLLLLNLLIDNAAGAVLNNFWRDYQHMTEEELALHIKMEQERSKRLKSDYELMKAR